MSVETLFEKNRCSISKSLDKKLKEGAENILLKKRFGLGEGYDKNDQNYNLMLNWIIELHNPELNCIIEEKLKQTYVRM